MSPSEAEAGERGSVDVQRKSDVHLLMRRSPGVERDLRSGVSESGVVAYLVTWLNWGVWASRDQ